MNCFRYSFNKRCCGSTCNCCCNCIYKEICKYCGRCINRCTQTCPLTAEKKTDAEKLQNTPALQCFETASQITGLHNNKQKTDLITDTAKVQNTLKADSNNSENNEEGGQNVEEMPLLKYFRRKSYILPPKKNKILKQYKVADYTKNCDQTSYCGLLHYRKWWEHIEVEISVNGTVITGIPIFIEENTLRIINNNDNYFIPLEKVDYIRTSNGLHSFCTLPDDKKT